MYIITKLFDSIVWLVIINLRERPFNLKGRGYGFFLNKYYDLEGKEIK
jgi:hypothetical protein